MPADSLGFIAEGFNQHVQHPGTSLVHHRPALTDSSRYTASNACAAVGLDLIAAQREA